MFKYEKFMFFHLYYIFLNNYFLYYNKESQLANVVPKMSDFYMWNTKEVSLFSSNDFGTS